MGQHSLAELKKRAIFINKQLAKLFPGKLATPLEYTTPWQLLVAVILSAQCTDKQVNIVTKKLFKKYPTLTSYYEAKPKDFQKDIYSTGFYKSKTRHILAAAQKIKKEYHGKIPRTMRELLTIPGVGRKTANVILGHLYNHVEGIAVDTHVRRLARKFHLTKKSHPDQIEKDLMRIVPQKEWWNFAYRLKAYGRTHSPARRSNDDPISVALLREINEK